MREYQIRFINGQYCKEVIDTTEDTNKSTQTKANIRPLPDILERFLLHLQQTDWNYSPIVEPIPQFMIPLLPHQQQALGFVMKRHRSLLAMEMGLGKTAVVIAKILLEVQKNLTFKTIIIVASGLIDNWKDEFEKFAPCLTVSEVKHAKTAVFDTTNVTLVSISLLSKLEDLIKMSRVNLFVVDEAHMLKNIDTKQSSSFFKLCKSLPSAKCVLMTGTPAQEHRHLYGLLRILHPVFNNWFHYREHGVSEMLFYFADRFCLPTKIYIGQGRRAFEFKINLRSQELQTIIQPFVLRILKSQVGNLPKLITETILIGKLSTSQEKNFQTKLDSIPEVKKKSGQNVGNAIMGELVRETMRLKIPNVINYINQLLLTIDKNSKFICFTHHKEMGTAICEFLKTKNIGFVHIDGDTKKDDRTILHKKFRENESIQVGVLSFVCSTGLNFEFVHLCLFCERIFDGVKQVQAESRIQRLSQEEVKHTVTVQYLDLQGSTDQIVERNIKRKKKTEATLMKDDVVVPPPKKKQHI